MTVQIAALVEADETAPLRPDSPAHYSATKGVAERMVLDADSSTLRTTVVRPRFVWDLTREEAATLIDVPFRWFFSQECTLVIDKARAQLGYVPVRHHDEALAELRQILADTSTTIESRHTS